MEVGQKHVDRAELIPRRDKDVGFRFERFNHTIFARGTFKQAQRRRTHRNNASAIGARPPLAAWPPTLLNFASAESPSRRHWQGATPLVPRQGTLCLGERIKPASPRGARKAPQRHLRGHPSSLPLL